MNGTPITIRRLHLRASASLGCALLLCSCGVKTLTHSVDKGERRESAKSGPTKAGQTKGSLQEAREQTALQPAEAYWPFHAAELYVRSDSLARAESWLEMALARDPGYAPALSLLSRLYFQTRRYEQGVRVLEAARAERGRFPDGFPAELSAALALHYDALGRRDLANQAMAGVPRSRAGSVGVYVTMRGDSPDSANAAAVAMARERPKSAANQNNAGIAQLRAGDPEAAAKAFLRAIELDPNLPGPYYNLAILEKYYRLDDAAAERWYRKYRQRSNDDPDGLAQAFDKVPDRPVAEKKD